MQQSKFITISCILFALLCFLFITDLCVGSVNIFNNDLSAKFTSQILFNIRLPKALTALTAGAGLALSGLLMQTLFQNPLAGPYALGITAGSSLFVAIATMLISSIQILDFYFFGKSFITLFSCVGAAVVLLMMLFLSNKNQSNVTILLVGFMLSQVFGGIQTVIEFLSSADNLKTFVLWSMGSLDNTSLNEVSILSVILISQIIWAMRLVKPLNAILLNNDYAQNLGVNLLMLRLQIILITSVLVGFITAFCGSIAFIGLSVPIVSKLIFKTTHHFYQIIFTLLLGAITLLFADVICQLFSNQMSFPINAITTVIGAPVIIYLLFKSKLTLH